MSNDEELAAGVPVQKVKIARREVVTSAQTLVVNWPTTSEPSELTDEQIGIPVQRPASHSPVKEPGGQQVEILDEEGISYSQAEAITAGRVFASPILTACLVLCLAALLIVILSEVFQFIQSVQSAPLFLQVIAYGCIGILTAAFCWAIARLAIAYRQLVDSPQVRLDRIRDARSRAITRDQIERQVDAGYASLLSIVKEYPIQDQRQISLLRRAGMKDDELATLKSNIANLLKPDNAGRLKWIEDCERLFIGTIDCCAKRRVSEYARRVAVKTALSPTGLIDSLIVAVNAVFMVEELCRLYFVRTSRWHSVLLAGQLVFSTFISAKLDDRVDDVTDTLFGDAIAGIPEMLKDVLAKVTLGVLKRTAEGTINLVIFYRLGASAVVLLRPIRVK
ncbi:MAG: DUF697 domain-containing protein [Betaproteobacteria bacterium]|nr:DUF697 domain-containing protein [Betaproteobacteria bacterium]